MKRAVAARCTGVRGADGRVAPHRRLSGSVSRLRVSPASPRAADAAARTERAAAGPTRSREERSACDSAAKCEPVRTARSAAVSSACRRRRDGRSRSLDERRKLEPQDSAQRRALHSGAGSSVVRCARRRRRSMRWLYGGAKCAVVRRRGRSLSASRWPRAAGDASLPAARQTLANAAGTRRPSPPAVAGLGRIDGIAGSRPARQGTHDLRPPPRLRPGLAQIARASPIQVSPSRAGRRAPVSARVPLVIGNKPYAARFSRLRADPRETVSNVPISSVLQCSVQTQ